MKTLSTFFFTFLMIAMIGQFQALSSASAASSQENLFAQMDAYLQERMKASSIPGGGYAFVKDGEVLHMAAFGVASLKDNRPLTVQTPMMIGSVGKTITALAVQQLAGAGEIELSAPITHYLPWFELATPGAAEQITVQNLLDHKSGLSKYDGQSQRRVFRPGLTSDEIVRSLKDVKIIHPVGTVYEYSNLNFVILGSLVETVSKQSYAEYIQAHIFDPLDMQNSGVNYAEAKAAGMTDLHRYLFGFPVAYDEPFPKGSVAIGYHITSIEDMAHYAAALSNGGEYNGVSVLTPGRKTGEQRLLLNNHWESSSGYHPLDSLSASGANVNANAAMEYMPLERIGVVVIYNANPYQVMNIAESASDITNDLLRMYVGIPEFRQRGPSTHTVYAYIDTILLGLAAAAILHGFSLRNWRDRLQKTGSRTLLLTGSVIVDCLVPFMILLGLPYWMQASHTAPFLDAWPTFIHILPDIAYTLLAIASTLLLTGMAKLAWFVGKGIFLSPGWDPV